MAKSWPELVRLRIDTERLGNMDYRALIIVESNLPYLQSLVLSMDMPGAWTLVPPTTPHKLRHLQVPSLKDPEDESDTPLSMQEQCEIAAFLDTLFPALDVKSFYTGGEDRGRSGLGPSMDKLIQYLQDAGKRRAGMVLRGIKSR
ncbi:hypothetical protein BJ165DRAFT_1480497 [Panaeolus papilionaceus]|nr:hypothetical protein BJ165DRAFT_1480497 [Panaeolus papilionaceus]